jgi:hypothetical protein
MHICSSLVLANDNDDDDGDDDKNDSNKVLFRTSLDITLWNG